MARNTTVTEATGLAPVSDIINTRRSALFGHTVRLENQLIAHLNSQLMLAAGAPHPHFGGDLAVGRLIHGSDRHAIL